MKNTLIHLILVMNLGSLLAQQTPPATFEFINMDPAGVGFNDTTVVSPSDSIVGNNPGTTLGELRQNVLQAAGDRWSRYLKSAVPIRVRVDYEDFGSGSGGAIALAGARTTALAKGFTSAPSGDVYYPIALANSLVGVDLAPTLDDISVTINSNSVLDDANAGSYTWYYGLDNNTPAGMVNFLVVITHELSHGLGFAAYVNLTTGDYTLGSADVYTSLIQDTQTGKYWDEMTSEERLASASNDPFLVWDGAHTNGAINGVESYLSAGTATVSESMNAYTALPAEFGGTLDAEGLEGQLVLVDDGVGLPATTDAGTTSDAAQPITNGGAVFGNIALIERGENSFAQKVSNAQQVGAVAVVIMNNRDGDDLVTSSSDGNVFPPPTIPVIFVSENTGNSLKTLLEDSEPLIVTMNSNNLIVGEEDEEIKSKIRLYAPSNVRVGSSISHWTTNTSPNLLMEPSITNNTSSDLDLSPLLMKDIGWQTRDILVPHLKFDTWLVDLGVDPILPDAAPGADWDGDGISNLVEYLHGMDPTENTNDLDRVINIDSSGCLCYERSKVINDIVVSYEASSDLVVWNEVDLMEDVTTISDEHEEVRVPVVSSDGAKFYRLNVQQQ